VVTFLHVYAAISQLYNPSNELCLRFIAQIHAKRSGPIILRPSHPKPSLRHDNLRRQAVPQSSTRFRQRHTSSSYKSASWSASSPGRFWHEQPTPSVVTVVWPSSEVAFAGPPDTMLPIVHCDRAADRMWICLSFWARDGVYYGPAGRQQTHQYVTGNLLVGYLRPGNRRHAANHQQRPVGQLFQLGLSILDCPDDRSSTSGLLAVGRPRGCTFRPGEDGGVWESRTGFVFELTLSTSHPM
jgi:hypothetical protein